MRIALDIDDVLARFMQAYCDRFETDKYPKRLESKIITRNVQRKLQYDRNSGCPSKLNTDQTSYLNYIVLNV